VCSSDLITRRNLLAASGITVGAVAASLLPARADEARLGRLKVFDLQARRQTAGEVAVLMAPSSPDRIQVLMRSGEIWKRSATSRVVYPNRLSLLLPAMDLFSFFRAFKIDSRRVLTSSCDWSALACIYGLSLRIPLNRLHSSPVDFIIDSLPFTPHDTPHPALSLKGERHDEGGG